MYKDNTPNRDHSKKSMYNIHLRKQHNIEQNFQKISILVKISENFKFGQIFRKTPMFFKTFRFWSKLLKNLDFGHFILNLDLYQIVENKYFGQNFRKKTLDFD